jgi:hypothetical protein
MIVRNFLIMFTSEFLVDILLYWTLTVHFSFSIMQTERLGETIKD